MQIKVTLDQSNYEYLKASAEKNRRTLSAELNTILEDYTNLNTNGPGITTTPAPTTPHTSPTTPTTPTPKAVPGISTPRTYTYAYYENKLKNKDNEYYNKIKNYCLDINDEQKLLDILANPRPEYLKSNYEYTIFKALGIPVDHKLDKDQWNEIAEYLK